MMLEPGQAFRVPHEQVAAGFQADGQAADYLFLSLAIEIDHHVTAEDNREERWPRKRMHEIQAPENSLGSNGGFDTKSSGWAALRRQIGFEPMIRQALHALCRIDSTLGISQRLARNIGPGQLNLCSGEGFVEQEGQSPKLFSRRTARTPDRHRLTLGENRKNLFPKEIEVGRLTQECRVISSQRVDKGQERLACFIPRYVTAIIPVGME